MIYTRKGSMVTIEGVEYKIGGYVIANENSAFYNGLIGVIREIRTGEDKDTDNETDDIYVCFDVPANPELIKEIEANFSGIYGYELKIDDIALDEVIMPCDMLDIAEPVVLRDKMTGSRNTNYIVTDNGLYSLITAKKLSLRDALHFTVIEDDSKPMYVVTNMTPTDNYTPMLFSDKRKAIDWMLECTARNVIAALEEDEKEYLGELIRTDRYEEIIETVQRKGYLDVSVENNRSEINYLDDTFNIMKVFECEVSE